MGYLVARVEAEPVDALPDDDRTVGVQDAIPGRGQRIGGWDMGAGLGG
jgi:hypothetical protein